ncbi:DUF1840 domain-containing protein [Paraburkholderia strydomiana]|jgi:hypothetical protein|uniref:DUF1840 domain-containing protein n=1 Tax=Paraburkholderia strydomiana TaxID=1245417 RepID=A0ABW9ERT0_9BURK
MLITFRSPAAPDVVMLKNLAQYLLNLIGKHLGSRGVIQHNELPRAIDRLETAISEEAQADVALESLYHVPDAHGRTVGEDHRGLGQRAWPLLDMMREASKHNADILWGL